MPEYRLIVVRSPMAELGDRYKEFVDIDELYHELMADGHIGLADALLREYDAIGARAMARALRRAREGRKAGMFRRGVRRTPDHLAAVIGELASWYDAVARQGCAVWWEHAEAVERMASTTQQAHTQPGRTERPTDTPGERPAARMSRSDAGALPTRGSEQAPAAPPRSASIELQQAPPASGATASVLAATSRQSSGESIRRRPDGAGKPEPLGIMPPWIPEQPPDSPYRR